MYKVPDSPRELGLPFDAWWPNQQDIIDRILNSTQQVVLLRARTGFGKQSVPSALAELEDGGVLAMTQTIQLQEQYAKQGFASVKGRGNFQCPIFKKNCSLVVEDCREGENGLCAPDHCEYSKQRFEGEISHRTVTNYAFGLRATRVARSRFAGRSWIVADEGQHILDAIEAVLIEEEQERVDAEKEKLMAHKLYAEARKLKPLPPPVWPSHLFERRIANFAERILVMSATLPPKSMWCKLHLMEESQVLYLEAPNTWPDNSPVRLWPVAYLNKDATNYAYDQVAEAVARIIVSNPNVKGLIHPHSYAMMRKLQQRLGGNDRIIWAEKGNRMSSIEAFMKSPLPLVLCATAVNEGFNLPYELGFQVICKTPWPDLGNPIIKQRARTYRAWYQYETVNALVQAVGRAARAPDDYGVTYIVDAAAQRLFDESPEMWPDWLLRQVKVVDGV